MSWHSIRDNFCELSSWISLVSASLGKIAYDVMLMMQTEIQEVNEPLFMAGVHLQLCHKKEIQFHLK